jgi:hypothetical protein
MMENLKRIFAGIKEDPRSFLLGFAGWFVFITLYWGSVAWASEFIQNSENPAAGIGFMICFPGPILLSNLSINILLQKKRPQVVPGILWAFGVNSIAVLILAWIQRDINFDFGFTVFLALSMIPFFAPLFAPFFPSFGLSP